VCVTGPCMFRVPLLTALDRLRCLTEARSPDFLLKQDLTCILHSGIQLAFRPNKIAISIATAYVRSTFLFSLHTNVTESHRYQCTRGGTWASLTIHFLNQFLVRTFFAG
jgi:hypothetical protein